MERFLRLLSDLIILVALIQILSSPRYWAQVMEQLEVQIAHERSLYD